jgi:sigma-54 dependent transcriptional regulator, acetoin dehydrogenase operon transcriptional activator AcoR
MSQLIAKNGVQSVAKIRQDFLTLGHVEQGQLDEAIERSWRRCLVNGVAVDAPMQTQVISEQELAHRIQKNRLLLNQAEPEMLSLSEQIAHTKSVVILTDSDGVILRTMGEAIVHQDSINAFLPGVSWNEKHRGTNAIGTALVERAAISVQGAEHFMTYHHSLNCSAVPIFSADNQLVATLDVSNDMQVSQQHTLALVKMAAQMVENRLFRAESQGDVCIHFHARPEFIGTLWEGMALFNHDGTLQALNRSGQFQFDASIASADIANRNIRFDDIFDLSWRQFKEKITIGDAILFPLKLQNGARMYTKTSHLTPSPVVKITPIVKTESPATLAMLDTGDSQLRLAINQVKQVINRDIPLLIQGETGAGKELFARAVHAESHRRDAPLIAINCAAMPEGLIEAELFGYEEGAYTGAKRKGNLGKIQQAHGGTLFLDEIGDMPLSLQARLLRVLQERCVTPLGSSKSVPVDFSLICATNQKLKEQVANGAFRSDLYYRINGLGVHLPTLRAREDLLTLVGTLLEIEHANHYQLADEVLLIFKRHPWPGNIRQLHNVIRTAVALADDGVITMAHLTRDFLDEMGEVNQGLSLLASEQMAQEKLQASPQQSAQSLEDWSLTHIRAAMQQHQGNVSAVARALGISRNTLYRKLKRLGLM